MEDEAEGEAATSMFVCEELAEITHLLKSQLVRVNAKERELSSRERQLDDMKQKLEERERKREERVQELLDRERQLEKREGELDEREGGLEEREEKMRERERQLQELSLLAADAQSTISDYVREQVSKTADVSQSTIDNLKSTLLSTEGELERVKQSFEESRRTNHHLRNQLDCLNLCKSQLDKDVKQLQARVASLQAARSAQSLSSSNQQHSTTTSPSREDRPARPVSSRKVSAPSSFERDALMALLLDWLTQTLSPTANSASACNRNYGNIRQILPLLSKVLPEIAPTHHAPFLKITLLSVSQLSEKGVVMSSLRSIGRQILSSLTSASKKKVFLQSSDVSIRTLSSLCLLVTLNEDDAHLTALQSLLHDLSMPECLQVFVEFNGVSLIAGVISPDNKRVTQNAVAIFTILSLNCVEHCANEVCINAVATLLKEPTHVSMETLNNLTIFLQRLSENRVCWRWFRGCGLLRSLERMRDGLVSCGQPDTQFRLKNIQSIFNNKPQSSH